MKVPLAQPVMTEGMIEAAMQALRNERLTLGDSMFKFEEMFAKMVGVDHAVSVNSGTAALQLALQAAGVKTGHSVVTSAMSFVATSNAFVAFGAVPVFCDVLENEYTMDPLRLKKAVDRGTKAVIPVHLYGYPCRMDEIDDAVRAAKVVVIEDACQAHGAVYKGKRAGALGDFGCFSFYPTKNMSVGGDGGMITTNDAKAAELMRRMRHCGRKSHYEHDVIGYTMRLNTVNAAIGIEQLKLLDGWNEKRRAVGRHYDSKLEGVGDLKLPPPPTKEVVPVYHLYTVRTPRRDELKKHLESKGVQVGVHYEIPIHLQPIYREMFGFKEGSLPVTERLCRQVLTLPMFPDMTTEQVEYVCESVSEFYG